MLLYTLFLWCAVSVVTSNVDMSREYVGSRSNLVIHRPAVLTISKRQAPPKPGVTDTPPLHVDPPAEVKVNEKEALQTSHSEGGVEKLNPLPTLPPNTSQNTTLHQITTPAPTPKVEPVVVSENGKQSENDTTSKVLQPTEKPSNTTVPKSPSYQPDLSNPGVMKRGLIVFGGFALMAVAYFMFYRRKNKNNDANTHGSNDTNQFRYGVLQSDDRRDNLELSRILTVESDEDEDEDLAIFDLEQKKKSLSYVNLQTNDDYVVHGSRENITDRDNLLLDIEDANSDTLINWSSNGNKSIL